MKTKILFPVLAILFAVTSAFVYQAPPPPPQTAYWHISPVAYGTGTIDNTTNECAPGRSNQCLIDNKLAYETPDDAKGQVSANLMKFNN